MAAPEQQKGRLEDQLAGRTPVPESKDQGIQQATDVFLKDKKIQGITDNVIGKYTRELARLRSFCENAGVYTIRAFNRELLTQYCATWEEAYPSGSTRVRVRERLRNFLRYCYQAEWLSRVVDLPKMKDEEPPTMPLTEAEYKKLLERCSPWLRTRGRCHQAGQLRPTPLLLQYGPGDYPIKPKGL